MRRDFDSDIFGKEKNDSFQISVAQISKGFREIDFYPSIEEKAATFIFINIMEYNFCKHRLISSRLKVKIRDN